MLEYLEPVLDNPRTVWATCVIIYALNHVLVRMRPEMTMDFGFIKWNQCLMSGLPTYSPLLDFGTVKNSPGLHWLDQNVHVLIARNIARMNGFN